MKVHSRRSASLSLASFWAALFFSFIFVLPFSASAQFQVPTLTGPVVDEAGVIDRNTEAAIENALRALRAKGGSQIAVLTVKDLGGTTIEQASIQVTDQWKLGTEKGDNGVLLMLSMKERRIRIEVGQGLEGVLTDADSKRIIEDAILPLFRSGDINSGILVGLFQITRKTDPDVDLTPFFEGKIRQPARGGQSQIKPWLLILIIIVIVLANLGGGGRRRGFRRGAYYGGLGGFGGGFGGRGGGFGGGGGWGGGGGGFSGGGASGGW